MSYFEIYQEQIEDLLIRNNNYIQLRVISTIYIHIEDF